MFDYFEKLRQKPLHVRRSVLFFSSTLITGLIFTIWLSFWSDVSPEKELSTAAPGVLLEDNWDNLAESFREGWGEMKNQIRF